jgi:hypothetical protein
VGEGGGASINQETGSINIYIKTKVDWVNSRRFYKKRADILFATVCIAVVHAWSFSSD